MLHFTCTVTTPCPHKKKKNCFGQNFVKFLPLLIIVGTKVAKKIELCEVY